MKFVRVFPTPLIFNALGQGEPFEISGELLAQKTWSPCDFLLLVCQ